MSSMSKKVHDYDVFARISRGDDLMHIGTVEAEADELAIVYATYVYDEEDWFDMYVVKRENLISVKEPKGLLAEERVESYV
jgi:1,2-phenylacetyl-CoA epoxidase PaaB subunit